MSTEIYMWSEVDIQSKLERKQLESVNLRFLTTRH